jgi:predicted RNA binding protein YcfA (HicA-like mRNA interferase family)
MSQIEKLVARFLREPAQVRFEEVITLLQAFDYRQHSVKGSHFTFVKPGARPITVPTDKGRRVKGVYVQRIIELLELEEWYEERKGQRKP